MFINITDKNLSINLEDYVIGVIAGEMPALFEEEALKAQAIAARSYVLSKNSLENIEISSTINDQIYLTKEEMQNKWRENYQIYYEKIKEIVKKTENLVIKKDNKILKTFYFAMSNGYTENSRTVFGDDGITSVESNWETEALKNFKVTVEYSAEELSKKLNIESNNLDITDININKTNHVDNLKVNNIIFSGIEFRKLLNLRSTDYTIEEVLGVYKITTRGYGHGVGMSQYGANEMAKNGYNYEDILRHYYGNIKIEHL
ncbi:MAG: stage II sporulation protein D [Bacilli bacterium]|nr:stage II sporulation protein D [Bacilli bacterium]